MNVGRHWQIVESAYEGDLREMKKLRIVTRLARQSRHGAAMTMPCPRTMPLGQPFLILTLSTSFLDLHPLESYFFFFFSYCTLKRM